MDTMPLLSPLEARVLGVLMEKERTTPDAYPLTLNALVSGCNQKSSRFPVMNVSEAELQLALDGLRHRSLVVESSGASGRVMRYAHNFPRVMNLGQAAAMLLAVLMLRGPQTPGELRINTERLHRFADLSTVEAYLEELATRPAGALVLRLARQPGSREHRWAQLLCGEPAAEAAGGGEAPAEVSIGEIATLKAQVAQLSDEVVELRGLVERLYAELGVGREPG